MDREAMETLMIAYHPSPKEVAKLPLDVAMDLLALARTKRNTEG